MAEMNQGSGADGPSESTIAFRQLDDDEQEAWEEVAIGKGLALYNSVEIDRLRGVKRSVSAVGIPA
jgi:glutamate 5-kinase